MSTPFQVQNLHAGYGKAEVLRGINLQLPRAASSRHRPNGAGNHPAHASGVFHHGTTTTAPLATLPLEERVMQGVALVPEARAVRQLSVEDNLYGAFRQVRQKNKKWRDQMGRVRTLSRLKERRHNCRHLSGGERQMLAVARPDVPARLLSSTNPAWASHR